MPEEKNDKIVKKEETPVIKEKEVKQVEEPLPEHPASSFLQN